MRMNKREQKVPPEGGWGYVVTLGVSLAFIVTVVPVCAFGMVFGNFFASLGDETSGLTLTNGIFNTILSFTGLPANHLLQKYSCRKVGLMGAGIFFIGAFGTIFVTNLWQIIISFGVFQGAGFGLIMPAVFSAFNTYFDKRKNVMMSIAQALIVLVTIAWPGMTKAFLEEYGFRGTVSIFAAISLNAIVACSVLQPVKWHMKTIEKNIEIPVKPKKNGSMNPMEVEPFLDENHHHHHKKNEARRSVVSIGSFALSTSIATVNTIVEDENLSTWGRISKNLDLVLFKDPVYVNIVIGLSLSMTSDLAFLSVFPLLLTEAGLTSQELTLVLTIYFVADLACRVLLSFLMAFVNVNNRYLFLIGTIGSAVFRTAFIINNSFLYLAVISSALGFLRCLIQTPLPLVVAEAYSDRFTTAFSLYMVVCGFVSLIFSVLIGYVRTVFGSAEAVVHLLTIAFLLCGIPWSLEIFYTRCCGKKKT